MERTYIKNFSAKTEFFYPVRTGKKTGAGGAGKKLGFLHVKIGKSLTKIVKIPKTYGIKKLFRTYIKNFLAQENGNVRI